MSDPAEVETSLRKKRWEIVEETWSGLAWRAFQGADRVIPKVKQEDTCIKKRFCSRGQGGTRQQGQTHHCCWQRHDSVWLVQFHV